MALYLVCEAVRLARYYSPSVHEQCYLKLDAFQNLSKLILLMGKLNPAVAIPIESNKFPVISLIYRYILQPCSKPTALINCTFGIELCHDIRAAQDMAQITPTGMIFVPSVKGISHSPQAFTSAEDMANGASVLFKTVLEIDGGALE
jgi:hypothetical protein